MPNSSGSVIPFLSLDVKFVQTCQKKKRLKISRRVPRSEAHCGEMREGVSCPNTVPCAELSAADRGPTSIALSNWCRPLYSAQSALAGRSKVQGCASSVATQQCSYEWARGFCERFVPSTEHPDRGVGFCVPMLQLRDTRSKTADLEMRLGTAWWSEESGI
jgi:hypothetical protein